jgi:cyanophycinase
LGNLTSELSSSLVRSLVLPSGILARLKEMLGEPRRSESGGTVRTEPDGPLVISAGLPLPDEIIVSLIYLVGGRQSRLVILASGTDPNGPLASGSLKAFTRFGMTNVALVHVPDRQAAESPELIAQVAEAQGIILVGDQSTEALGILAATELHRLLHRHLREKRPVAVVGPIASLAGDAICLAGQDALVPGLGLAPGMLVATDWSEPARAAAISRAVVGEGGRGYLGLGLDPQMAVLFRGGGEAKVYGPAGVTFLDGISPAKEGATAPKLHVLMEHYVMNLRLRRPGGPVKEIPAASGGNARHG